MHKSKLYKIIHVKVISTNIKVFTTKFKHLETSFPTLFHQHRFIKKFTELVISKQGFRQKKVTLSINLDLTILGFYDMSK